MTPLQKSIAEIEANRNEKIKTIAEFDGWEIDGSLAYRGMGAVPTHSLNYLTNLNALHLVIKKIRYEFRDKIEPKEDAVNAYKRLGDAIYDAFDSDSLVDLIDAVYDAIVYLKKYDPCQPK